MKLILLGYDVEVTKIDKVEDNFWVGITINTAIRSIDAVACFTKNKIFSYFAYGCDRIAYNGSVYWVLLKMLNNKNILEKL